MRNVSFSFGFNKKKTEKPERATETTIIINDDDTTTTESAPKILPPISTIAPRVPPFRTTGLPPRFGSGQTNKGPSPFFSGSTIAPRVPPFRTTPSGDDEGNIEYYYYYYK